ncbi:MAG: hypothetical protein EA376_12925 [Phycisphaeraceae bacterium]|nr:MAG: hypothetical protein EA376_12925 [Phycisphaeraceae bacterium]
MIEWWSQSQTGWIGGVGGAAVGVIGGCFGALAGVLAKQGRGERFVVGGLASMAGVGAAALGVGLVAVLLKQPWHVWYPFALLGLVLVFTATPLTFSMRRIYEQAGARRLEAELLRTGAERGARSGGAADGGFIFTAVVASAIVSGGAMAAAIAALHNKPPAAANTETISHVTERTGDK